MQLITHLLVGVIIQILCFKYLIFPLNLLLTIVFAFLSHFIVDIFSKITYHTPEPQRGDKFWLSWQILTYGSGIIALIFLYPYIIGMLFANFVDIIDWLILRPLDKKRNKDKLIDYKNNYYFHKIIDKIREKLFFWLPNWNYNKYAVIPEITIIISLGILIFYFT
jgi:hypothetical protein